MKRLISTCVLSLLLIIPSPMVSAAENTTKARPVNSLLIDSLRQGGYILYVRHGEASVGEDQPDLIFSDCSTQRNLSEEGRRQATALGEAFRRLQIPVQSPVLASPFCRTRETAELAFGEGNVQADPFWVRIYHLSGDLTPSEREAVLADLTSLLEKGPSSGTNKVIVAHSFPRGVGLDEIPNLGIVVVKPRGQGKGYEMIGRITLPELLNMQ